MRLTITSFRAIGLLLVVSITLGLNGCGREEESVAKSAAQSEDPHRAAAINFLETTSMYRVVEAILHHETEAVRSGVSDDATLKPKLDQWLQTLEATDFRDQLERTVMAGFSTAELTEINAFFGTGAGLRLNELLMRKEGAPPKQLRHSDVELARYFGAHYAEYDVFRKSVVGSKFLALPRNKTVTVPVSIDALIAAVLTESDNLLETLDLARFIRGLALRTDGVLVANVDLKPGGVLALADIGVQMFPDPEVSKGSLNSSGLDLLVGGEIVQPVARGKRLTWAAIAHESVIVVRMDLAAGEKLQKNNLAVRKIAATQVSADHFMPNDFPQVNNQILAHAVGSGKPVLRSLLLAD